MTSLFRRSSSNGGSRNSSSAQELNNSRPARQVRRLEFNQAMEDFKTMFPNMDYDIIECVLRANNGAVDATIDQLLQMNLDGSSYDDSSDSDDSIPPECGAHDGDIRCLFLGIVILNDLGMGRVSTWDLEEQLSE
uniref:CUE domain-containing protein 1 n=1 Tax=Sphaerodactylus townsendi TaxID=933632 RepID=A0ACB8ECC9_9SAUR